MKERFANVIRWMGRIWTALVCLWAVGMLIDSSKNFGDLQMIVIFTILALIPSSLLLAIAYILDGKKI